MPAIVLANRVVAGTTRAMAMLRAILSFGPALRAPGPRDPVPERQRLPALGLAIAALIGAWCLVFEIARFVGLVRSDPAANDFRLFYLAAQVGEKWGWSHMYDPNKLQALTQVFGPGDRAIIPS